jgi:hypothetical protein
MKSLKRRNNQIVEVEAGSNMSFQKQEFFRQTLVESTSAEAGLF